MSATQPVRIRRSLLLGLVLLLVPALASATQLPREHEGGVLIRLSAGLGAANFEGDNDLGERAKFDEPGGNHNLAFGGILFENFALHATAFGWAVTEPRLEVDGQDQGRVGGTASLNALGAGVTWYTGPSNFYLSGSIGFAWLTYSDDRVSLNSATGGALDLTVGKEWWVSDRWGLGVALGLQGYGVPLKDGNDDATGGAVGLRFSATFN